MMVRKVDICVASVEIITDFLNFIVEIEISSLRSFFGKFFQVLVSESKSVGKIINSIFGS